MEIYSRVVGFYRPVGQWNVGKQEEFEDRIEYKEN
jgi:ribonucleoside-triphosphate reductase